MIHMNTLLPIPCIFIFVLQDFTFFFNHNVAYAAFQQCITEEHHQGLLSSPNYYLIPEYISMHEYGIKTRCH